MYANCFSRSFSEKFVNEVYRRCLKGRTPLASQDKKSRSLSFPLCLNGASGTSDSETSCLVQKVQQGQPLTYNWHASLGILHWRALARADTSFIYFTPLSVLPKPSALMQPWRALFFLLLQCADEIQGDAGATDANAFQQRDSITKILHRPITHNIKPLWSRLMIQISYSRAITAGLGVSTQSTYSVLPPQPCLNRQCNGTETSFVNIR